MDSSECINVARNVFDVEIDVLQRVKNCLGDAFSSIAEEVDRCKGKVLFVGMGKPGRVNGKVAATFSSLGIPSVVLHPGEAMHGDLGVVQRDDLVIVVSYSGESDEVVTILPLLKRYGSKLVAVTGNSSSTLAKAADIVQVFPKFEEADPLGLAPTSSTTAWLAYADALAVAVSASRGFTKDDFGGYHPAGSLGKKLLYRVDDLMATGERNATVSFHAPLTQAIAEIGRKGIGMTCIVDEDGVLMGVITDGDLRRQLERGADIYHLSVDDVMSRRPVTVPKATMALDALRLMRESQVAGVPVVDEGRVVGCLQMQAIVDAGIVA